MKTPRIDVAVVGAGIVGLSTAEALQRRGLDVRCFESTARAGRGQSGGLTRIFRHRHDDEALVALSVKAEKGWRALEERTGRRLLGHEGVLFIGADPDDRERFARLGIKHRDIEPRGVRSLFPIVEEPGTAALFDEDGGAIRAKRAIEVLVGLLGDRLVTSEVLGIRFQAKRAAVVDTPTGWWNARHVVLCAGAQTAQLAATVGLDIPIATAQHVRLTFAVREAHARDRLACWVDTSGTFGDQVYGSPVGTSGSYAIGLAGLEANPLVTEEVGVRDDRLREAMERVEAYVARGMPGLYPEVESARLCTTTTLPGGPDDFGVFRVGPVTALAGNNLFKFAPILGELLADAATTGHVPPALAPSEAAAASAATSSGTTTSRAEFAASSIAAKFR